MSATAVAHPYFREAVLYDREAMNRAGRVQSKKPGCHVLVDGRLSHNYGVLLPFLPVGLSEIAGDLLAENRQVVLNHLPYGLELQLVEVVGQHIAHQHDVVPLRLWMLSAESIRQLVGGELFVVTLPSKMANFPRLGKKKLKSFVLCSTFRNFAANFSNGRKQI